MRTATLAFTSAAFALVGTALSADPLTCNLTGYKALAGLTAAVSDNTVAVAWDGEKNQEVRLRLTVNGGTPTIVDLATRSKGGPWVTLASNVTPEFLVVSGLRRATDQQLRPLKELGVSITPAVLDQIRWEAFWDSPLNVPGDQVAHGGATPPAEGIADQLGLPRKPEEVRRAGAVYQVRSCAVKTNGARLEVSFPGVKLGVFDGRLEYTVYKGSSLIRQAVVTAEVEWTFPLEMVEVVWGDGQKTDRQIISATDLPAFGRHRFQLPFDATGKKWVRFAVWDSAGNGAFVQPIKLQTMTSTAAGR